MTTNQRTMLVILDGWGLGTRPEVSALAQANTPFMDSLLEQYPHTTLVTHGEQVGLPKGQMGNSEVGHLNIGAGRIVYQELLRINNAIKDGSFARNETLLDALAYAQKNDKKVHLLGLLSDGGVHSHLSHLKAITDICEEKGLERVFIHAFLDGRDTSPTGGIDYLKDILAHTAHQKAEVASIIGRYYAMDRDKRWERVRLAYDLLVKGKGEKTTDPLAALQAAYDKGNKHTDEFMQPLLLRNDAQIEEGDVVIFYNFRTDRPRQLTEVLTQNDFPEWEMKKLDVKFVTMTRYDANYNNVDVIFSKENLKNTLGEVLENAKKSQVRIAETEKYPHVTFFFSGGQEACFNDENRILIPSPKVDTYDLQPEMSANEITSAIIQHIEEEQPNFICLNYANTDMVGHTGIFKAAVKAAETVDSCLEKLMDTALSYGYDSIVIADHGNSDFMINEDGTPNTAHTTNLVPCILIPQPNRTEKIQLQKGKLADIAPSILQLMGIPTPKEMTGCSLIQNL